MKAIVSFILSALLAISSLAQEVDSVQFYLEKGVQLHDRGDYHGAISCYEKALKFDNDNPIVLAEIGYSLSSLGDYDAAMKICEKAISIDPTAPGMEMAYTTYGNALDITKHPEQAIKIYDKGIALFPASHMLHFNKGITLVSLQEYDEALACFQASTKLGPTHPGSHNAMGILLNAKKQNIPALMALCRFLLLEPTGSRATKNLGIVKEIMTSGAQKTGKKSVSINIDPMLLADTKNKNVENNFNTQYLILSTTAALRFDKKNKDKTEVELFMFQFESLCRSLEETQKDNYGFYWEYYAPYFISLYNANHLEPFSYIVFASSGEKYIHNWLDENPDKVDAFYEWSSNYDWSME